MKHLSRIANGISAVILLVVMIMPINAFADGNKQNKMIEINAVLDRINDEYGTNIHVLSPKELAQYGIANTGNQNVQNVDLANLERTLRHIAEVEIPRFERNTQKAIAALREVGARLSSDIPNKDGMSKAILNPMPISAEKAIDYAIAGANTYIMSDSYGNTVWGNVDECYCRSNVYWPLWFMAGRYAAVRIDGNRTIHWAGEGDYGACIEGIQYYIGTGT